jgi:hypothetical protein
VNKTNPFLKLIFATFIAVLLVACNRPGPGATSPPPPGSAPSGDYGDAPDGGVTDYPEPFAQTGQFPSLFSSNGARALQVNEATLGPTASEEVDADDPADPDGGPNLTNSDSDDGLVDFFITLTAIPPPTTLSVDVVGAPGITGGKFYINAVIDLNMDGVWGGRGANGELEWVVQNQPVQVNPGTTTPFTSPPFGFSNGNLLPDGAYMRIALTKETVPNNWDGTGEFSSGEIEDHIILLPEIDGKETPVLSVDCNGPYQPGAVVTCLVTNLVAAGGNFTYNLAKVAGGTVNVPLATCNPGAPGGGPVAIGPNQTVGIACTSTPGTTPTTWRFTARVQDPPAVVVEGGIRLGHSEESTADFDFEGEPKTWQVYLLGFQGSYQHFSGYSMVLSDVTVAGDDPMPMENATVTLQMTRPDGSTETQTTTTGPDGMGSVEFTIYVYGTYTVEVLNIEGENMEYAPDMNAIDSLEVEVGPGESTPVGVEADFETEAEAPSEGADIEAFVEAYNAAFQAGDVETLFNSLHPAVLERYGTEACRGYLESVIDSPIQIEVLEAMEVGSWIWELDGRSTTIQDAFAVQVNFTALGKTNQQEIHFARLEDGTLAWFTDCGEPLE